MMCHTPVLLEPAPPAVFFKCTGTCLGALPKLPLLLEGRTASEFVPSEETNELAASMLGETGEAVATAAGAVPGCLGGGDEVGIPDLASVFGCATTTWAICSEVSARRWEGTGTATAGRLPVRAFFRRCSAAAVAGTSAMWLAGCAGEVFAVWDGG